MGKETERAGSQPIAFLAAGDKAGVYAIFEQPVCAESDALKKRGGIADEGVVQRRRAEHGGDVAGRGVENGFRKDERAGGGGVAEDFIVKTPGVIDAAGHDAEDAAETKFSSRNK